MDNARIKYDIIDNENSILGENTTWELYKKSEPNNMITSGDVNIIKGHVEVELGDLEAATEYLFNVKFEYDLTDGNGTQSFVDEGEFTTKDSQELIINELSGLNFGNGMDINWSYDQSSLENNTIKAVKVIVGENEYNISNVSETNLIVRDLEAKDYDVQLKVDYKTLGNNDKIATKNLSVEVTNAPNVVLSNNIDDVKDDEFKIKVKTSRNLDYFDDIKLEILNYLGNVEKEFILNKGDITSLSGQELLVDNLISNQLYKFNVVATYGNNKFGGSDLTFLLIDFLLNVYY